MLPVGPEREVLGEAQLLRPVVADRLHDTTTRRCADAERRDERRDGLAAHPCPQR